MNLSLVLAVLFLPLVYSDSCSDALQARLDCYDTPGPCDPLPIPSSTFASTFPLREDGLGFEKLRDGLYAVTEGTYWFMVAVSEPNKESNGRLRGLKGKKSKSNSSDEKRGKKTKEMKKSKVKKEKEASDELGEDIATDKYSIAVFDMPEGGFSIIDEMGAVVGTRVAEAVDEIVFDMFNITPDDIGLVQMVYSHHHFDHVGSGTLFYNHIAETWMPDAIEIIAHQGVKEDFEKRIAANYFSFRAPVPTVEIEERTIVTLGPDVEYVLAPVEGHSSDKDLVIFFEATDSDPAVMMYVDVVFPGWAPFFSFAITTDLFAYRNSHYELLQDFEFDNDGIFVGGHLNRLGSRQDIELSLNYTEKVIEGAGIALSTTPLDPIVIRTGIADPGSPNVGNTWLLFDEYFIQVSRTCAKIVVEEYGCVLAAVDMVTESACRVAQSFLRVDF